MQGAAVSTVSSVSGSCTITACTARATGSSLTTDPSVTAGKARDSVYAVCTRAAAAACPTGTAGAASASIAALPTSAAIAAGSTNSRNSSSLYITGNCDCDGTCGASVSPVAADQSIPPGAACRLQNLLLLWWRRTR